MSKNVNLNIRMKCQFYAQMCVRPGSTTATEFMVNEADNRIAASPLGVPQPDTPDDWNHDVALRVDMSVLEQVEAMEDKVANASMQVKVSTFTASR